MRVVFWQICEESEMTSFASQIISAGVFKQQTYQAHCLVERSFFKMRWNTEIQGHNPQMGQPFILKWHIAKCWLTLIIFDLSFYWTLFKIHNPKKNRATSKHKQRRSFSWKKKKELQKNLVHLVKQTTEFMFNVFNKTGLFTYNVSPNYR